MCSTRREQQPTVSAWSSSFSFPALSANWNGNKQLVIYFCVIMADYQHTFIYLTYNLYSINSFCEWDILVTTQLGTWHITDWRKRPVKQIPFTAPTWQNCPPLSEHDSENWPYPWLLFFNVKIRKCLLDL